MLSGRRVTAGDESGWGCAADLHFNPTLLGGGERTRTADFYVANVALYRTELHPRFATHDTGVSPLPRAGEPPMPLGGGPA